MMITFGIFDRATGQRVNEYMADAPIEWSAWPFDKYEHKETVDDLVDQTNGSPGTVYAGRRKLTKLEWRKLLHRDEEVGFDRIRATVETMAVPDEATRDIIRTFVNRFNEATIMDLDDPDQERGFNLLVSLGVMQQARIKEILNG